MKQFVAIFTLLVLTMASFYQLTLTGIYLTNKQYISQAFCVNKDKPALKCNGKCHLKKNMAQAEEKQAEDTKSTVEIQLLSPVFFEQTTIELPIATPQKITHTHRVNKLTDSYLFKELDPPRII